MNTNVIESAAVIGAETATQEGDITMDKVYTFRKLNSTDMFLMFKIIGKIGINEFAKSFDADTLKGIASMGKDVENANTMVGISLILEIANIVFANMHKCENEIYQLLANTSDRKVHQIQKMDIATFTEMVIDFIKKEEFKDFFKVVLRSFKSMK